MFQDKNTLVYDCDIIVIANKFLWKYLRQNKVNLLKWGPTDPTLSEKKKKRYYIILANWLFSFCCFLIFEEKINKT